MKTTMLSATVIAAACVLHIVPAQAQSRVFVAAQGSDANPCTFALPCRTFQRAHDTVAAGGEIDVLDPAGYGMLTISKAISIQGHGFSGISVALANNGITINAGPTDAVHLNGLLIDGGGVGTSGIAFNSGRSLAVENCIARNLGLAGLAFISTSTTLQTLSVSNSYFIDTLDEGIVISAFGSGAVVASLERVGLSDNGFAGLNVVGGNGTGPINVAVTDSVAGNNDVSGTSTGFLAQSAAAHSAVSLVLTRSTAAGNHIGVMASGTNATVRMTQSTVTGNTVGYDLAGGTMFSYGDNLIDDNGGNVGALTGATRQ